MARPVARGPVRGGVGKDKTPGSCRINGSGIKGSEIGAGGVGGVTGGLDAFGAVRCDGTAQGLRRGVRLGQAQGPRSGGKGRGFERAAHPRCG